MGVAEIVIVLLLVFMVVFPFAFMNRKATESPFARWAKQPGNRGWVWLIVAALVGVGLAIGGLLLTTRTALPPPTAVKAQQVELQELPAFQQPKPVPNAPSARVPVAQYQPLATRSRSATQEFLLATVSFYFALAMACGLVWLIHRLVRRIWPARRSPKRSFAEMSFPRVALLSGGWFALWFVPVVIWAVLRDGLPYHERLPWQDETKVFVLPFVFMMSLAGVPLGAWAYTRIPGWKRAILPLPPLPNGSDPAAPQSRPSGEFSPEERRLIANRVPVVGCIVVGAFLAMMIRCEPGEPAYLLLMISAGILAVFVAVASVRLKRWAYPQWLSTTAVEIVPPVPPAIADMPEPHSCPRCRTPIAADAPQGLCPRCLMAGAFQSILHPSRTGPYAGGVEAPTPEAVQEFFPHLEILGLIGQGGMGAVYQARQPNLDRIVAVKLIRPREDNPMFAERFVREAKAMAKLTHPNVVTIYESGEAGGSLYLIMEYIDGVTLREAIRAKAVDAAAAMKIVGQLCDALEYAHAQGVVHRDIKPENILLDRAGRVKVVDFGLAKLADDNAMSLTHTRQAMGTPHYMAPEQWEKPTEVDHRADIYALGVVIYELLTGELPLGRFDPPSVKARLDARIDEIVLRLLAKEPDKRYQKASDVRTALFDLGPLAPADHPRVGRGRRGFYEYKSETKFLGWPLVHVVRGIDPRTGTRRIAMGWIAVGDLIAIGVLAVSGVFSLGLFAVAGVLGLGGLALAGAFAVGGGAVGGNAVGGVAVGGVAVGWLAVGGVAVGKFAYGERVHRKELDPEFWGEVKAGLANLFGG